MHSTYRAFNLQGVQPTGRAPMLTISYLRIFSRVRLHDMWLGGCLQIFKHSVVKFRFAFQRQQHSYQLQAISRRYFYRIIIFILSIVATSMIATSVKAQNFQLDNQALTSTTHDVAVALEMLPFNIDAMKTEAVVLAEDLLLTNQANQQIIDQQIIGRSAFANSDTRVGSRVGSTVDSVKLNSKRLLQKVIQPPKREDFNLNGAVAYVESLRSHVVETYGAWEAPAFREIESLNIDKLVFDQDGYLVAQKSYYYDEEIPDSIVTEVGGWLSRFWWPGKNRSKKRLEEEASAAQQAFLQGKGRKIEGCYALDIDFEAEGFDCFDEENRILYVTEWSPEGKVIKRDSYHLHADGPWVALHLEENLIASQEAPTYKIERYYDLAGNLIEYKSSGNIEAKHLRFFYNENNQRVTEAVLDRNTGKAVECKFLTYGYFDTLEVVEYHRVKDTDTSEVEADANQSAAFRSPLAEQNYTCEKKIPSILTLQKSTVMAYGWLYDDNNLLAGRRKQEMSKYDAEGALIERIMYGYLESEPTTLAAINKYNDSGQSIASIVFDYDKQGRLVKEERLQFDGSEAGKLLEQSNYIYKAKETTLLEKTTEDFEHSRSKIVEQYDEAGNLIREQRYELFNRLGILSNIFRLRSDVSRSYTGRSFVNEIQKEEGNTKVHESYTYVFDYEASSGAVLNWIQKDEGSFVDKFDSSYAEPHHTIARIICYYPDSQALSPELLCTSPF